MATEARGEAPTDGGSRFVVALPVVDDPSVGDAQSVGDDRLDARRTP